MWSLSDLSDARTGIAPPVQYPSDPRPALLGGADPLVAGHRYQVSVTLGPNVKRAFCLSFLTACPSDSAGAAYFTP
jgi:hypothetical protein